MSDIVERLRWRATNTSTPTATTPMLCDDAADEITRLRAALRFYAGADNYKPRAEAFGDGMYAPLVILDAGYTARAALKEDGE